MKSIITWITAEPVIDSRWYHRAHKDKPPHEQPVYIVRKLDGEHIYWSWEDMPSTLNYSAKKINFLTYMSPFPWSPE
jgi:hypothetical protein